MTPFASSSLVIFLFLFPKSGATLLQQPLNALSLRDEVCDMSSLTAPTATTALGTVTANTFQTAGSSSLIPTVKAAIDAAVQVIKSLEVCPL